MFERYNQQARKAVFYARYEANQTGSAWIEAEHLLLGILHEEVQLENWLPLSPADIQTIGAKLHSLAQGGRTGSTASDLPLSSSARRAMAFAAQEAEAMKNRHIGPEHLVVGISCEESSPAAGVLRECGWSTERLRGAVAQRTVEAKAPSPIDQSTASSLRDMVQLAADGEYTPLVGRELEMERIVQILCRRTKNNAVLIGEAGIGKTAIVEGLAQRLAQETVPRFLAGHRLLALDTSSFVSPGQRSNVERVLSDVRDPANTILFIRGLFNLATAGSTWRLVEAMHALEPLLTHSGTQCIATGSASGLRATVERAGMLARHFEIVAVEPVNQEHAIRIVSGLKSKFEHFHGVTFSEGAIETAVHASGLFLPGRHLPDRAIDLIDEAATSVKLRMKSETAEIVEVKKRIRQHVRALDNAVANHEFDTARLHSDEERKERENLARLLRELKPAGTASDIVTPQDIAAAAAARAGISLAAAERLIGVLGTSELQQVMQELTAAVAPDPPEWLPLLAAYLLHCSRSAAEALATAITSAKAQLSAPKTQGAGAGNSGEPQEAG
jgi:ATP-dependent Clp protease ATP-binding subunit ClpC